MYIASIKIKVMRKDFRYPIRIITRKEEIQSFEDFGFVVTFILLLLLKLPLMVVIHPLAYLIKKGGMITISILWLLLWIVGSYLYFSS